VFAKEPLFTLCRKGDIDAVGFASFRDIIEMLNGAASG